MFPYESNPVRCQGNFTQVYSAGTRLATLAGLSDATSRTEFITDLSYILKAPFGISYSCYYGFSTILVNEDPMADGVLSPEEELEELIEISNQIFTNIFFNLGYMYQAAT